MAREKGEMIARGRTAEIFAWKDSQVLKLYQNWCPAHWIEEEVRGTQAAYQAGLPVPAVEGIVEVDGRRGIVFERVDGPILSKAVGSKPWKLPHYARMMAELHAAMHSCEMPGLPSQREALERTIRDSAPLPANTKEALLEALAQLPNGSALCHGDFHPDNIIMSSSGPIIIDWMTPKQGNPLADVARTSLCMGVVTLPFDRARRWLINCGLAWFHSIYLKEYLRLRPASRHEIDKWLPLHAAARLIEPGPEEEKKRLLEIIEAGLKS